MKKIMKNQISSEIFKQIALLEEERNQEKQKVIAQEIINELNVEDFTPYMAYDDESNIFIAMYYYYSAYGIEEALLSGKHDVVLISDDIYIEDEYFLEECRKNASSVMRDNEEKEDLILKEKIKSQNEDEKREIIKLHKNQKKYDEISERLKFLNNQLMNLVNFERPKCVGNYEKITEIDEEINSLENLIDELEKI